MKKILIALLCASFILTGCENLLVKTIIPEEIVEAAIDTNQDIEDYYIETTMKIYEGDKLTEESTTKEWNAKIDGQKKRRTEASSEEGGKIISSIDNNELIIYMEEENEFYNFGNVEDVNPELNKNLRDRTKGELDAMNTLYDMETIGEETINGAKTYHIKGSPKKKSALLGDYEMWIDKENWIVMKSVAISGDIKVISENIKVDIAPKIDPSIFKLDIPSDAKELNPELDAENKTVTLDEANEYLDNNLLVIKDEDFILDRIESMKIETEEDTEQFNLKYTKNAGEVLDVNVMKMPEDGMEDLSEIGLEEIDIRGHKGEVIDDILKMLTFEEEGNYYILIAYDEEMTLDDIIKLAEGMELYK